MGMLFTPFAIGSLTTKNRFVRSATYDGGAEPGGFVSKWQIDLYTALARGEIGLIVSGIFNVDSRGKISPSQNSIQRDHHVEGLSRLVDAVHAHGAKIAVQLFHGGREAFRRQEALGQSALGPSDIEPGQDPYFEGGCKAMTEGEIEAVVEAFGKAAARVRMAGADAVQIHGAHAYLLSQFLSPQCNRREDQWGGPLIQELEGQHVPSGVPCVALHSPVDNLVLPAKSLTPPPGWREEATDPICHVAMLYHGPTIRRVLNHIKGAVAPSQA